MAVSLLFKTINLRHFRVQAFFVYVSVSNREGGKNIFLCLKKIVQNGNDTILDFKMNISYECSLKGNKCQKSLWFLEIRVMSLCVLKFLLLNNCHTVPNYFLGEID